MPSWSKTEAFSATVEVSSVSSLPGKSVGSSAGLSGSAGARDSSLDQTAYTIERPPVDPNAQPKDDPLIGTTIDHFQIRGLIGQGGMGRVYLAHDLSLERPVALKLLRQEYAGHEELVKRLLSEARAQARIQHPHVVSVYYIGQHQGAPYIAMEWVNGMTVGEYLERHGALAWPEALEVVIQTARALFHSHLQGFSHRDVKPSNIILTQGKQYRSSNIEIKVADFGLAAPIGKQEQHFVGTPRYAPPEAIDGRRPDHRSDIYALGITFYELLTGNVPFNADTLNELFSQHRSAPRPVIPEGKAPWKLRMLITEMMDANPAMRPYTYEDLLHRLTQLRPKEVTAGGVIARGFAWAIDLALIGGLGQVTFDKMYLNETTAAQATLIAYGAYYIIMHRVFMTTIGKRVMGLRIQGTKRAISTLRLFGRFVVQFFAPIAAVVMISMQQGLDQNVSDMNEVTQAVGRKIPLLRDTLAPVLKQVLVPNILVAIPWVAGFLFALFDENRQTLHDRIGSTKVVYAMGGSKEKPESERTSLGGSAR